MYFESICVFPKLQTSSLNALAVIKIIFNQGVYYLSVRLWISSRVLRS